MSKIRREPSAPTTQAVLSKLQRENMLAVLIRNKTAFLSVCDLLSPENFSRYDSGLALTWAAVLAFYKRFSRLPKCEELRGEVEYRIENSAGYLTSLEVQELDSFIDMCFDDKLRSVDDGSEAGGADYAMDLARRFLVETHVMPSLASILGNNDSVPVDAPSIIAKALRNAEIVSSLSAGGVDEAYQSDWETTVNVPIEPTNIMFLDKYMAGGNAAGELYGLLGPYGSCKSTIAYMLAVEAAMRYRGAYEQDPKRKTKIAFVVSYEDRKRIMQLRTMGYAASIPRSKMINMTKLADLANVPQDYEKIIFGSRPVSPERERVADRMQVLNSHLCLLDMTGSSRKGVGSGGIQEVAQLITRELRMRGTNAECGTVIIDYVGAMARRYLHSNNMSPDQLRHVIGGAPILAKDLIADSLNCPVWLLQQLTGQANAKGSGLLSDHTDAAEAKNFGENLDFAFVIGRPDAQSLSRLGCTKHRRTAAAAPCVVRIVGDFNRVDDVSDMYFSDGRRIMLKSEAEAVVDSANSSIVQNMMGGADVISPR